MTKTERAPVPNAWKGEIEGNTVDVLPLVDNPSSNWPNGWCTYLYEHDGMPDVEFLCGGINGKTPEAAALWRQGHLLHFGFEQSPADLNENGRAMLVNSIHYIARFTEDRPIARTGSSFSGVRIFPRKAIARLAASKTREMNYLTIYASESVVQEFDGKTKEDLRAWYETVSGFLHADGRGKIKVDEEAREYGVSPANPEFIPQAIKDLSGTDERSRAARLLLNRYMPDGPGHDVSADAWNTWWQENRDYLFFTDTGGYRWYIDPLAKKRKVPTAELRGPTRATLAE